MQRLCPFKSALLQNPPGIVPLAGARVVVLALDTDSATVFAATVLRFSGLGTPEAAP